MGEASHPSTTGDEPAVSTGAIEESRTVLKFTYAVVPIVAGLDKFANVLVTWADYLNPVLVGLLPVEPTVFMWVVGVVEIAAGIAVLSRWTREAAYVVSVWLLLIAVNLLVAGQYDVAVRDVVMAIGAFVLARLTGATGTSA